MAFGQEMSTDHCPAELADTRAILQSKIDALQKECDALAEFALDLKMKLQEREKDFSILNRDPTVDCLVQRIKELQAELARTRTAPQNHRSGNEV